MRLVYNALQNSLRTIQAAHTAYHLETLEDLIVQITCAHWLLCASGEGSNVLLFAVTQSQTVVFDTATSSKVSLLIPKPSAREAAPCVKCKCLLYALINKMLHSVMCASFSSKQSLQQVIDGLMAACMQSLLDEMGAERDSTAQNPSGDLVVARPEAVYFYSVDGRGPCFVFEGASIYIYIYIYVSWCFEPLNKWFADIRKQ